MTSMTSMTSTTSKNDNTEGAVGEFVTAMIGGQLFGLPISRVQDVFMPERLTRVPLSAGGIAGVPNLHGRIVPVWATRARLGRPGDDGGQRPRAQRGARVASQAAGGALRQRCRHSSAGGCLAMSTSPTWRASSIGARSSRRGS